MQQLSGIDASFLSLETGGMLGHVSGLVVIDPSTADPPLNYDDWHREIEARLHLVPPFRRRLVEVPLGLDFPYWIEDPHFDLDYHLRHIALPAPGDREMLADQVARIHSRPLDRARPLWEMYLIEGLEGGRAAVMTKFHHAAIDGVSGAEILAALVDLEPTPSPPPPPDTVWTPEAAPDPARMLAKGAVSLMTQPARAVRFGYRTARSLPGLGALVGPGLANILTSPGQAPELLRRPDALAPRTPFNHSIGRHRRLAFAQVSLEQVKAVKNRHGVTVNDVVMAMCSGAIRAWLGEYDHIPERTLVAMVPISVRDAANQHDIGNHVSSLVCSLATDVEDPIERLRTIHEAMAGVKEQHDALPADILSDATTFATPAIAGLASRLVARTRLADRINPLFNVVISNVPGPPVPLYTAGARIEADYPVSAIIDGVGLNITVMSLDGHLDFGLVACRDLVEDLWFMADALQGQLDLLDEAPAATA
ncbi:MAG: wax ester/triacylglycerol synthase family O-acyltransferase [Acidimicrobiia bacterium]|nr:wax ester/triacylglycerol synthase family O-acyltransferase [Acidimicrobiia bacterium]